MAGVNSTSDLTLVVGGERIPVHKSVLSAGSPYFKAMFSGGFEESAENELTLHDVTSPRAFKSIIRFIYTGHLPLEGLNFKTLLETFLLAHFYQLVALVEAIPEQMLSDSKTELNQLIVLFDYAVLYDLEVIKKECQYRIEAKSRRVLNGDAIIGLSAQALKELLSSDHFLVDNEMDILVAIKRWIKKNPGGDKEAVLSAFRPGLISNADMFKYVKPTDLISASKEARERRPREDQITEHKKIINTNLTAGKVANVQREGLNVYVTFSLGDAYLINRIKDANLRVANQDRVNEGGLFFTTIRMDTASISRDSKHWQKVSTRKKFPETVARFVRLTYNCPANDASGAVTSETINCSYESRWHLCRSRSGENCASSCFLIGACCAGCGNYITECCSGFGSCAGSCCEGFGSCITSCCDGTGDCMTSCWPICKEGGPPVLLVSLVLAALGGLGYGGYRLVIFLGLWGVIGVLLAIAFIIVCIWYCKSK